MNRKDPAMLEFGATYRSKLPTRAKARHVLLLLTMVAFLPAACRSDGLIGGDCAEGYAFCDGACISVTDDETNCGGCNIPCRRNLACVDGICGGPDGMETLGGNGGEGGSGPDGSGAGASDGTGGINVGAGGPGGQDGSGSSPNGSGNSSGSGGAACLSPLDSPSTCGSCDVACPSSAPNCSPTGDGGYECTPNCTESPYVNECSGKCVDLQTDARHCGSCSNACASGICLDGACIGAASGHQVAICASYERNTVGQTELLANSIFLGPLNPVRILGYIRDTGSASEVGTDYALSMAAQRRGRDYTMTKVTALNSINNQLNRSDFDVLLVYDQQNAPSGRLPDLGTSWAEPVDDFSRTGGAVVILTGGANDEMGDFIENLGLFSVDALSNHDGERFYVQAPGDAIGINVVSPFLATRTSCLFETSDSSSGELVFVVTGPDPPADPAVVHRIVPP